jgi:hypothetical protein
VVVEVDVKSTTYETVIITTSNVDTAIVVVYVTATAAAVAKRAAPTQQAREDVRNQADRESGYVAGYVARLSSTFWGLVRRIVGERSKEGDGPISPFAPRIDPAPWTYQSQAPDTILGRDTSTVTTTIVVTSTADITSTVSVTQTSLSTAFAIVTNSLTQTKYACPLSVYNCALSPFPMPTFSRTGPFPPEPQSIKELVIIEPS